MALRIGLTGGIGSGKSTVAELLRKSGASVINTDAIAGRLTAAGGAAMPALRDVFGGGIAHPDGALDRDAMRVLAFNDPAAKLQLESVLHPMIAVEAQREASVASSNVLVFEVPLLAESTHWRQRVDRVLIVDCNEVTQVERVARRAGWTPDMVTRVIASQASRRARRSIADAVIFNDGIEMSTLARAVETIWHLWQPLSQIPVKQ